jgi:hypothetical protein
MAKSSATWSRARPAPALGSGEAGLVPASEAVMCVSSDPVASGRGDEF